VFGSINLTRNIKVVQNIPPQKAVSTQFSQFEAQIKPNFPKTKQLFEPASSN